MAYLIMNNSIVRKINVKKQEFVKDEPFLCTLLFAGKKVAKKKKKEADMKLVRYTFYFLESLIN